MLKSITQHDDDIKIIKKTIASLKKQQEVFQKQQEVFQKQQEVFQKQQEANTNELIEIKRLIKQILAINQQKLP